MSLSAKILAPMLLLITLFAVNTLYSAQRLNRALERVSVMQSALSALPNSFRVLRREAEMIEALIRRWERLESAQRERVISVRFAGLNARLSESLIRLEALKYPPQIEKLQRYGRSLLATYVQLEAEFAQYAKSSESSPLLSTKRWQAWVLSIDELSQQLSRLGDEEARHQEQVEEEALYSALLFTSLSFALGLIFILYLSRLIEPIRGLTEGVTAFREGNYNYRIQATGSEEFSQLAIALNQMGETIEVRDSQLLSEQQRRLQEASLAAAGHLSAQITHELRNPLSSIGLNSELLSEELLDLNLEYHKKEELRSLLSDISREIERLKGITEEYLRYARIPPPNLDELDLNSLCQDIIDFSRAETERFQVVLTLDPDPIPRLVRADANQLRSAIINLIRNACEALEEQGGFVKITVRTGGGTAKVTLEDNGLGIPKEYINRIFEPFFSTKPQGTGLGLSMVQQLVKAQSGRIELDEAWRKERYGEVGGTVFSIYLPLI